MVLPQTPDASEARRPISKMLLGDGGSAQVEVDGKSRMLMHSAILDRPPRKLPWPLSRIQAHDVSYTILANDEIEFERKEQNSWTGRIERVG